MQDEMNDLVNPYYTDPEEWVHVVRCKDCKHYGKTFFSGFARCEILETWEPAEHYCSDGERKE